MFSEADKFLTSDEREYQQTV